MVIFFQKGNRKYINNYRPICLLSNMYKRFAKISGHSVLNTNLEPGYVHAWYFDHQHQAFL